MPFSIGSRLGCYEILAPIGAGGMGEVYRARDSRLGRDVAIKVLPEHLSKDPQALARFDREARAIAALSHPNILAIYDVGSEQGVAYTVTELLEGETLRSHLGSGALPWRKACRDRSADCRGPFCRALQGHCPPGSEAGERLPDRRRPSEGSRLRPGAMDNAQSAPG